MTTDGYTLVAPADRGAVDVPATSTHWTAMTSVGYNAGRWRASLRAGLASETRGNGTPLQRNQTDWHQFAAEAAGPAAGGLWTVRAAAGSQTYAQTFTSVSAARDTERLTSSQNIPTTFGMVSGQWVRTIGRHALMVGTDASRDRAEVRETRYSWTGSPAGPFLAGGSETLVSVFARRVLRPARRFRLSWEAARICGDRRLASRAHRERV